MNQTKNRTQQISLYENARLDLEGAIELSLASLREYGKRYRHYAIAYSGGKDSSATVTFVTWAIKASLIPAPESLTVLYADTRMELPPLQQTALKLLESLRGEGFSAKVVMPPLDDRFLVYMLGRGVPPSNNKTFRWCTPQIKVEPMQKELFATACNFGMGEMVYDPKKDKWVYQGYGSDKVLMLTGVRLGESTARDQVIAVSCSKDSGECGQGWFQVTAPKAVADTLAPLLHWRVCHVYDWLYFSQDQHGYDVSGIASVYGEADVRTGCVGCPLANRDVALERLIKTPEWAHLKPLLELKPLYRKLRKAQYRLRKSEPEIRKDGKVSKNVQRLGPLTMEIRAYGLETVLDIQARARVDLINPEEEARIRELWNLNTWPQKWKGDEITGDVMIDAMRVTSAGDIAVQPLLIR